MSASNSDDWLCANCGRQVPNHLRRCQYCEFPRMGQTRSRTTTASAARAIPSEARRDGTASARPDPRIRTISLASLSLLSMAWIYLLWDYHKWDAQWGSFSVLLVALAAAACLGLLISGRAWYRDRTRRTGWRLVTIPPIAFVVCAAAGIYFTEPVEFGGSTTRSGSRLNEPGTAAEVDRRSPDYRYDYRHSRAGLYELDLFLDLLFFGDFGDGDDACGIVALILLIVVLVIASFLLPHFWVLSTFVLLVIMGLVAYREWRLLAPAPPSLGLA
jgi:hypothetical protein